MEKNSDPARAIVTIVSPTTARQWAVARRLKADWPAAFEEGTRSGFQPARARDWSAVGGRGGAGPDAGAGLGLGAGLRNNESLATTQIVGVGGGMPYRPADQPATGR